MKLLTSLFAGIALMLSFSTQADDYTQTIADFKKNPIAAEFFAKSYGCAVFPTIGKGGFGIGYAHGKGQVYKGGAVTGKTSMHQASIGFQAGGQAYSQVIFFEDARAYKDFTSGNFEFAAGANAIAITASANAQTSTQGTGAGTGSDADSQKGAGANYSKGMAIVQAGKGGLMYEASVAGQKYSYDPK